MQSIAQQLEQRIQRGAAAHRDVVNLVSDYVDLLCRRAQYRVLTFGFSVMNMQLSPPCAARNRTRLSRATREMIFLLDTRPNPAKLVKLQQDATAPIMGIAFTGYPRLIW
jgi:hypothetical protein